MTPLSHPDSRQEHQPLVRITDPEHPHYPETGRFTGEVIKFRFGSGVPMAKIALDNCKHGTDACYVHPGQIEEIHEPRPRR